MNTFTLNFANPAGPVAPPMAAPPVAAPPIATTPPEVDMFAANLTTILGLGAATFTPAAAPALTCTNCHATAIQNGPSHWVLLIWSSVAHASASVAWGSKAVGANLYDPSVGTSAVKGLGAVSSATFAIEANIPLVIGLQK